MLDRTRRNLGHAVQGMAKAPHMIFQGSPGTGKTSLGRIMASLLHRIGVTSSPELKEVHWVRPHGGGAQGANHRS